MIRPWVSRIPRPHRRRRAPAAGAGVGWGVRGWVILAALAFPSFWLWRSWPAVGPLLGPAAAHAVLLVYAVSLALVAVYGLLAVLARLAVRYTRPGRWLVAKRETRRLRYAPPPFRPAATCPDPAAHQPVPAGGDSMPCPLCGTGRVKVSDPRTSSGP